VTRIHQSTQASGAPRVIFAVVIVISLLAIGLFAPGLLLVAIVAGPVLLIRRLRWSR
jgi:hypothetical protein